MQFNLKFMREFLKFFRNSEGDAIVNDPEVMNTREVGEINIITPKGMEKFALCITKDKYNTQNTAWMVKTVEGKFMVVFHIDYFVKHVCSQNMSSLYAVAAHEVGHYLSGHFDRDASGSVDIKKEIQDFFLHRYNENKTLANEITYMRSVFFALLKGGVIIRELEADMMALRFVPVADLVHIHTQAFDDKKNVFTVVEKVNRIKRLNQYTENNGIETEGYSLFIQLFDIKEEN